MSRLIRWVLALLAVAGVAFFIWQKTRPKPVEVVVRPVIRGVIEKTVANTRAGTVKACRRAKLSPSIGGQIAHLPIHEGDQVKAGALLMACAAGQQQYKTAMQLESAGKYTDAIAYLEEAIAKEPNNQEYRKALDALREADPPRVASSQASTRRTAPAPRGWRAPRGPPVKSARTGAIPKARSAWSATIRTIPGS